jgi:hypothetical protein
MIGGVVQHANNNGTEKARCPSSARRVANIELPPATGML